MIRPLNVHEESDIEHDKINWSIGQLKANSIEKKFDLNCSIDRKGSIAQFYFGYTLLTISSKNNCIMTTTIHEIDQEVKN